MDEQPERDVAAILVPLNSGAGVGTSVTVSAPVGAVSRRSRERAGRTALQRKGTTGPLVLCTALPGSVTLQRRGIDGTWETLAKRRASRRGHTRIELPHEVASSPPSYRVVFSPKNPNITAWISENIDR